MGNITFVYPRRTRPLSITGETCALSCSHCNGHYLKHMKNFCSDSEVTSNVVKSYLISGGCDSEGAVPLKDHLDILKNLSKKYNVIAHTGLIKEEDVPLISPYIHAASFNFIGEDSTIREVYNLKKTALDFIQSYVALRKEVRTFPHITIGIHRGEVKGEYHALDELSKLGAEALVFNVFIPTPGTEYENAKPPSLNDIQDVLSYAKKKMNKTPLYLGCMRPSGRFREQLDEMCVSMGMDRIVMPSKGAQGLAESLGLEILTSEECCII
ncbi:MAG: hypothetical protein JSV56_05435 [Methanomassiliicoccales archaeon]|nr:MAG: hypothetical protein JSV56_05435 [Methanomassiliicoccales archaeon]